MNLYHAGSRPTDARLVLAVVCASAFAVSLNGTMLPVALPEIGERLSLGPVSLGWLVSGYFLVNGVAIPFFGRLADLRGVAHPFAAGLAAFLLGSLLCAAAPGFGALVAGRLVQGAGAAAVAGLGPAAVGLAFPPKTRGRVLGLVGAAGGAGAAAGPVFGGLVTDFFGWRALFAAGVLFGALAPLALGALPRGTGPARGKVDPAGGLLFAGALGGALLALTEGAANGWEGTVFAGSVAVAAAASVGFVYRQATAPDPFVPRALLANPSYTWLCAALFLLVGAHIAVEVAVPLTLAEFNGLGPTQIGLVLLPAALLYVVFSPVAGEVAGRLGAAGPAALGAVACAAGLVGLSTFGVNGPVWATSALVGVVVAGITLASIALTTGVSLAVPRENLPSGTSVSVTVWISGVSVGTALFSAVVAARSSTPESLNPFHSGPGVGYSDAYLALAVPLILATLAAAKLWRKAGGKRGMPARPREERPDEHPDGHA